MSPPGAGLELPEDELELLELELLELEEELELDEELELLAPVPPEEEPESSPPPHAINNDETINKVKGLRIALLRSFCN